MDLLLNKNLKRVFKIPSFNLTNKDIMKFAELYLGNKANENGEGGKNKMNKDINSPEKEEAESEIDVASRVHIRNEREKELVLIYLTSLL